MGVGLRGLCMLACSDGAGKGNSVLYWSVIWIEHAS